MHTCTRLHFFMATIIYCKRTAMQPFKIISYAALAGLLTSFALTANQDHNPSSTTHSLTRNGLSSEQEWDLEAPPIVSLDQVMHSVRLDASNRIAARIEPLIKSGLWPLIINSLPEEQATSYAEAVEESGFDPAEYLDGFLFCSESEFGADSFNSGEIFVGFSDASDLHEWMKYMDREDSETDDEKDDVQDITITILFEQKPEDFDALNTLLIELDEVDGSPYETISLSNAIMSYRTHEDVYYCNYIWGGGMIGKIRKFDGAPSSEVMQESLRELLNELSDAATEEPEYSEAGLVFDIVGRAQEVDYASDLYVDTYSSWSVNLDLPSDQANSAREFVTALPIFKGNPELLKGTVPSEYIELAEIIIEGTHASMSGDSLELEIEIATSDIQAALESL